MLFTFRANRFDRGGMFGEPVQLISEGLERNVVVRLAFQHIEVEGVI
jgi:hypothetical protein